MFSYLRFKYSSLLILGIFFVSILAIQPVNAAQLTWTVSTVDAALDVGRYTSIALDSNGFPYISYYDNYWGDLKYARWNGVTWEIFPSVTVGVVGWDSSLALDSGNFPHISFYDSTNGDLIYYHEWHTETMSYNEQNIVDSNGNVGRFSSIAIGSDDSIHISYYDLTNRDLKYARSTGTPIWTIETIDSTGDIGLYSSLALDSNNRPHIAYYDLTNRNLKYARYTGTSWVIQVVDSSGTVGADVSLALDSNYNPHISYFDNANSNLKYARWTGSTWSIDTVDAAENVGQNSCIAIDSNDRPHISYSDQKWYDLKYAVWTGVGWLIKTVDTVGEVGFFTSIALDSGDHAHISYFDNDNSNLKYARNPNESFKSWDFNTSDSDGDSNNDLVEFTCDVDTTFTGSLSVYVYAELKQDTGPVWASNYTSISITSTQSDSTTLTLMLPQDAPPGPYELYVRLEDDGATIEGALLFDAGTLYPPQSSQVGYLTGTVTDLDTGHPMPGIEIYVDEDPDIGTYQTITNTTGQYWIELSEGEHEITAHELEGSLYLDESVNVTIVADTITSQDFQLERNNWILFIYTDGEGETIPESPGTYTWPKNTVYPVEAFPDPGYRLLYWLLDSVNVGFENPFPIFMDSDHNITAVFAEESQIGLLSGTVTELDSELPIEGVEVSIDGNSVFTDGAGNYEMQILAGNYSVAVNEQVHSSQEAQVTIIADSNTIQNFALERSHWTLTLEVEGLGSTNLTQEVNILPIGSEVVVEAFPDEGWVLSHWLLDSVDVGSDSQVTILMNSDHILTCMFVEETVIPELHSPFIISFLSLVTLIAIINRNYQRKKRAQ